MLEQFIGWWYEQMRSLLPQTMIGAPRWSNALLLDMGSDGSRSFLVRRQRHRERTLGPIDFDAAGLAAVRRGRRSRAAPRDLLIRLPPGRLLEHRFPIPLAAERDAANFLRYEIDRETPFNADEVFWTFDIESRDRVNGRLFVSLSMLPRADLANAISWLTGVGLAPAAIETLGEDQRVRHLPLGGPVTARHTMPRPVVGLAALCGLLALLAVVLPFVFQQTRIVSQERRIAALEPRVAEVFALRAHINGQAAGADVVAAERARVGDALEALAAITGIMPDNAFLTGLSLSKRDLTLTGQSGDAAGLISALSRAPTINSPSFSAPVTAAANGQGNLFSITASVAP
jgi:general secretion pathway protein L